MDRRANEQVHSFSSFILDIWNKILPFVRLTYDSTFLACYDNNDDDNMQFEFALTPANHLAFLLNVFSLNPFSPIPHRKHHSTLSLTRHRDNGWNMELSRNESVQSWYRIIIIIIIPVDKQEAKKRRDTCFYAYFMNDSDIYMVLVRNSNRK